RVVVVGPLRHATYTCDVALVAPGMKRGIDAWTSVEVATLTSVTAGDHVRPASSENVLRIVMAVGPNADQVRMMRPVFGLMSMNGLSPGVLVMNVVDTSSGLLHVLPLALETLTHMPCSRSLGRT